MTGSAYGQILGGDDIRKGAEAAVKLWWPSYAAEIARQKGLSAPLLPFKSFNPAIAMDSRIEGSLPACVIVAPGLAERPVKHGNRYEATWTLGVGAVVAADSFESALTLAEFYMQGLRSLILQQRTLGGIASGVTWIGESYDELPVEGNTAVLGPIATFDVTVEAVVDISQGLRTPPDDPNLPAEWPIVEVVHITEQLRGP